MNALHSLPLRHNGHNRYYHDPLGCQFCADLPAQADHRHAMRIDDYPVFNIRTVETTPVYANAAHFEQIGLAVNNCVRQWIAAYPGVPYEVKIDRVQQPNAPMDQVNFRISVRAEGTGYVRYAVP